MLLTGEPISALTAQEWGLVNRVVAADRLDEAVDELVGQVTRYGQQVAAIGKKAFYAQIELPESRAYELTKSVMASNAEIDDAQEGIGAVVGKRQPVWSSR